MLKTVDGFLYALSRNGHGWGDEGQMVHYKVLKLTPDRNFLSLFFVYPEITYLQNVLKCTSPKIFRIVFCFTLKFVTIISI